MIKIPKKKDMFCESYELLKKLCVRFGFLVISPFFEHFWNYSFAIL
jgi:hypothetical protein